MRRKEKPTRAQRTGLFVLSVIVLSLSFFSSVEAQTRGKILRPKIQTARVEINKLGYQPMSINLKKGIPARITFVRSTDETCATEVVFPDFGIRRDLPLNQTVAVNITPNKAGEFTFTCGMNMQRGKLIVR